MYRNTTSSSSQLFNIYEYIYSLYNLFKTLCNYCNDYYKYFLCVISYNYRYCYFNDIDTENINVIETVVK